MSASDVVLSAVAFQLAAALETYDAEVAAMLASPRDPERYRRVSSQMDAMRLYTASLPVLSVAWVELMIRHFELTHGLWRAQKGECGAAELAGLHEQLRDAVQRLARKCVQLMPSA